MTADRQYEERIRGEFTRQADAMTASPRFTDERRLTDLRAVAALDASMRVLDLGCGPGIVSEPLAQDVGQLVGLDLTPEMLKRAAKRCTDAGRENAAFVLGNSKRLPFADASFDVVVTRSAIHHFDDPTTVLAEVARILRAGGRLVLSDVVSSEDADESSLHNALETLRDPSHVRMLSRSVLLGELKRAGFEVESEAQQVAHREFGEWLAITNDSSRIGPLQVVMRELAEAGSHAGVNLRYEDGRILFDHTTLVIRAVKTTT
ncbi:MAG: class I SAM-dependent methyltransferase [Dehalococcoidia bacterium]